MSNLSPKATALINKYTPGEIAEQVVELEEKHKWWEKNAIYWKSAWDDAIKQRDFASGTIAFQEKEIVALRERIDALEIIGADAMDRYVAEAEKNDGLQALCMFEGNSSLHLLKLIADNLLSLVTPTSVKRAQANWLRRFIKVAANLGTGGDDE